ncbi:MAG: AAA family ATPase, partial [Rhodospirillales bacterium]|nr:AAA family ATPase [Rhodospirillales bacterium]
MSFSRLRIAGFKSFAEPAVVDILPGLTGIVGPNGCGKSNVVDALRWAMGESSARSMRGGEMDDVIFAGTAARPSRNLAEVTLFLDETRGLVPPPFHEAEELEVSRRIERGNGSVYRVNGREARARDVQTLFADLATGAHSSGMVSQGRVAAIVNAKPDERRAILEEAAGITGLHARRHEAELKLRAAETNLARAEDLRGQLEVQLESLKRQARQANRYRGISGTIRAAEAELLAIQRGRVERARAAARAALHAAESAVTEATAAAMAAAARAADGAAHLPALRGVEGEARTALERHRLAGDQIAAEEARARDALVAAAERLRQIGSDLAHARQARADAEGAASRLADEDACIAAEEAAHPPRIQAAEEAFFAAEETVRAAEAEANRATEHAADLAARHRALSEALAQAEQRARRLGEQGARLHAERERVCGDLIDPARIAAAETVRHGAEASLATARRSLEDAENARARTLVEAQRLRATAQEEAQQARARARADAEQAHESARAAQAMARARAEDAETLRARLAAEVAALAEILAVKDGEAWPPMVDQLAVPSGLEAALGAALGEELDSAADLAAARHWRALPPLDPVPDLPPGVAMLSELVQAPTALARALSQIGLAEPEAAAQLATMLRPGQMLVTRQGAVWRWDGYTIQAGAPTAAAVRLQQRNRLIGLRGQLVEAQAAAEAARQAHSRAAEDERRIHGEAEAAERAVRAAAEAAERAAREIAGATERDANAAEQTARS